MSDSMSGYTAYQTYLAVSRHFGSSYNFFKYNGKINVKETTYQARKDKYFFEKAARKFKRDEFIKFLVANFSRGSDGWIGQLITPANEITYMKWKKTIESLTYAFTQEVEMINDIEEEFDKIFAYQDGMHPLLFRLYLRNKVSLETMVLLDDLVNYTKVWSRYDDIMMSDFIKLLNKYKPFLHNFSSPSKERLRKIVLEIYQ